MQTLPTLTKITNKELLDSVKHCVGAEKKANAKLIRYLSEVEKRRAYLEWGYGSLFGFVTEGLGYDPASASRRVQAARAMIKMPEICKKIEKGEISLGTVQMVESFRYHEGKERNKEFTSTETKKLYSKIQNLSTEKAEQELANMATSKKFTRPKKETNRAVKGDARVISFTIEEKHQKLLAMAREIVSHKNPGASLEEIYMEVLRYFVERKHPKKKAERAQDKQAKKVEKNQENLTIDANFKAQRTGSASFKSRYIKAKERHKTWSHYDGQGCTFVSSVTKKRCCSHHRLQQDHIKPFAQKGESTAANLRILCQKHNLFFAQKVFRQSS